MELPNSSAIGEEAAVASSSQHDRLNERARAYALTHTVKTDNLIASTVSYHSQGRLLLVGAEDTLRRAATLLPASIKAVLLVCEPVQDEEAQDLEAIFSATASLPSYYLSELSLSGHLGQFHLSGRDSQGQEVDLAQLCFAKGMAAQSEERASFDLIADFCQAPLVALEKPPLGYQHFGQGLDEGDELNALCDLVGVFDKPRYFRLDPEICAFTARGVPGCNRCLSVCPTDALKPINGRIQIDPYLCQGIGSCASACPTGAIRYGYPEPATSRDYIYRLLNHYRKANGQQPIVLIAGESERAKIEPLLMVLPPNYLPLWCEESASLGLESWLAALAYGASQVLIAVDDQCAASVRALLEQELSYGRVMLQGAGQSVAAIGLFELDSPSLAKQNLSTSSFICHQTLPNAPFKGDKRQVLFAAFEALCQPARASAPLPTPYGAPFGAVLLNSDACTLCMSCVAVCPTRALHSVGESPGLNFIEQDCIQCGMCQKACPERAISLAPQFEPNFAKRGQVQSLKSEEAACCIRCGKAFAPASLIRAISAKLAHHSHFKGRHADRLLMCEDCRVKDVFGQLAADPAAQLKL